MGAEATCEVTFKGRTTRGTARLETNVLQIRAGDLKIDVPFTNLGQIVVRGGRMSASYNGRTLTLALGATAARWAERILNPPSLLAKLGVRPDWRAAAIGDLGEAFLEDLRAAVATLSTGRVIANADAIFFAAARAADLRRLETLRRSLQPAGGLWVVRPKGRPEITERQVMDAGRAAGLVDVKVVAFSQTHTAQKFVIPVKNRPPA